MNWKTIGFTSLYLIWSVLVFEGIARIALGNEWILRHVGHNGDVGPRLLRMHMAEQSMAARPDEKHRGAIRPLQHHPTLGVVATH